MNERIKEIEKQCWKSSQYEPYALFDAKKFSQLIVSECVDVLNKRFMGDLNREDMEVRQCIADVKKHFGVEL